MRSGTTSLMAIVLLVLIGGALGLSVTAQDKPKDDANKPADTAGDKNTTDEKKDDADDKKPVRTLKPGQVARLNERIITAEEFIQRLVERERTVTDPDMRTAKWALDSLIMDELLVLEANRLGAVAKRRWHNPEYDELMKGFDAELARINKAVVAWGGTPYTKAEFLDQRYHMSLSQFEAYQSKIATERVLRRQVVNYWRLATDSADAYGIFKRNLSDIKAVRTRLIKGEKLAPIARAESEDMHTRESGGLIGTAYVGDGSFEPAINDVFWKLEIGEWSQPIASDFGFWIVCKTKFYPHNEAPFFQLQEQCLAMGNPDDNIMLKWRYSVASSGLYTYEQRMPGWDCLAGED